MASFQGENGADDAPVECEVPGYRTTYAILTPGRPGARVRKGTRATVHAKGALAATGVAFWDTAGGAPFSYDAGAGGVIVGWDQGAMGMEVGEVRRLRVPAAEAYGRAGFATWAIPPGAALEFTLELVSVSGGGYAGEFMLPGVVSSLGGGAAPARGGLPIASVAPAAAQQRQPEARQRQPPAAAADAAAPAPICAANAWLQLD